MAWPTFEIVRFELTDPAVATLASEYPSVRELATEGVPRSAYGQCEAAGTLTVIGSHRRWVLDGKTESSRQAGPLVRFAFAGPSVAVALDPQSGEVVSVIEFHGPFARLMNTSLAHLRMTARAVIARFPFYDGPKSDEREGEELRAQQDLLRLIKEADPRAFDESGGWTEFPWVVGMGDYDTESVVGAG